MQIEDHPEIFGLNENVNTLYLNKVTDTFLGILKLVMPTKSEDTLF